MRLWPTGGPKEPRLIFNLAPGHGWPGTYVDLLPFLNSAHSKLIIKANEYLVTQLPLSNYGDLSQRLIDLLKYATFPDPAQRGHPAARRVAHTNPCGLERFITALDVIWSRANFIAKIN